MLKLKAKKSAFSAAQMKELLFLLNHEGLHAQQLVKDVGGQLTDIRHRMSNLGARLDGAWGKITTLAHKQEVQRQLTPDAHSVFVQPEKPFCVIANTARYIQGGAQGRSWYATQAQAEAHASTIMRNHPDQYKELYVVEIKAKVSTQLPQLEVTRY